MSQPFPVPTPPRQASPTTPASRADLAELVRGLDDLADRPVSEHHDRLTEVHEALHTALHEPAAPPSAP